jgi:hypothetical protein
MRRRHSNPFENLSRELALSPTLKIGSRSAAAGGSLPQSISPHRVRD